ncbi:MAG: PHB depolymerase family esterase [Erythrobacter sp.]
MTNFNLKMLAPVALLAGLTGVPEAHAQRSADNADEMSVHRFQQGGHMRRYRLFIPNNIQQFSGPRPLVLVIHGGAGTDRGMIKLDKGRWQALAKLHGFYVAYPNAVDKLWDFGEGLTSEALDNRVDDLEYFGTVLDKISAEHSIDKGRVFATGISRGGQASYFLACNMSERIRAIAPVAMALPTFMVDNCREEFPLGSTRSSNVAVAMMNGSADPQVPYNGGWITVFRKKRDIVMGAQQTAAFWRKLNGCYNGGFAQSAVDTIDDGTSVTIKEWSRKCETAPVKLYTIENGGHTWPSGLQYLGERIVGKTTRDIVAADEAWSFFSRF